MADGSRLVGTDRVPGLEQGSSLLANTSEELRGDRGEIGDNVLVEETLTLVRCEQLDFGGLPNLRVVHDTTLLPRPPADSQPRFSEPHDRPFVARGGAAGLQSTGLVGVTLVTSPPTERHQRTLTDTGEH